MKMSDKLRSRRWKSQPLTSGHAWEDDDTPLHASDCLERCEMLFEEVLRSVAKTKSSGDANSVEGVENRIRVMLLELRSEPLPVRHIMFWRMVSAGRCLRMSMRRSTLFERNSLRAILMAF